MWCGIVTGVQTCALPFFAEGWATPLASSVTVPDPTEVPVQVLEVVKNVNVTVPVGVPNLPLTVALSCTVRSAEHTSALQSLTKCVSGLPLGDEAVTSSGS